MTRLAANLICGIAAFGMLAAAPVRAETPDPSRAQIEHAKDYEIVGRCLAAAKPELMGAFARGEKVEGGDLTSTCVNTREFARMYRKGLDSSRLAGAVAYVLLEGRDMSRFDDLLAEAPAIRAGAQMRVQEDRFGDDYTEEEQSAHARMTKWQKTKRVLAQCAVRKDPALARQISSDKIDGPDDLAMVRKLGDTLAKCTDKRITPGALLSIRQALPAFYLRMAVKADPSFKAELS